MAKKEIDSNLLLVGGVLIMMFTAGKKILQAFGLSPDADDKAEEAAFQQLANSNAFDPDFWKKGGSGTLILTAAGSASYAEIIYKADKINDDEAAVYGVFEALKTKSQVSYLSQKFFERYRKSLKGYLGDFLDSSELAKVATIVNKMPNYRL